MTRLDTPMASMVTVASLARLLLAATFLVSTAAMASGPAPKKTQTVKGNITLTTSLANDHVLMPGQGLVHLAIDLDATKKAGGKRLPMNIALVIDRSGSMRGEKIQNTRRAAKHLVAQLTDKDTLAIISYSDDVRVDLPASRIDASVKKQALAAIDKIRAGGSTNLSGGLFRGQAEVERNVATGQVNRVLLMSDGLANRGITDTKALSQQVQKGSQRSVSVTTMGVGSDYNEDLMTAVADHAGGNYYFIQESKQVTGIFRTELQKMFATVAQNTIVEVTLDDGVDLKQVFGYTFTRQGDTVKIPLAEMFAGQKRSILLEVEVPVIRPGTVVVGGVKLSYIDIAGEGDARTAKTSLAVSVTRDKALVEKNRNRGVEERVEEVQVAQVMTKAADLVKAGRSGEAQGLLKAQAAKTAERARGMGGSKRLSAQVKQLKGLQADFEDAAAEPAAAPAAIKRAKEKARLQIR